MGKSGKILEIKQRRNLTLYLLESLGVLFQHNRINYFTQRIIINLSKIDVTSHARSKPCLYFNSG